MADTVPRLRYSLALVATLVSLIAYADWHQVTDVPQFPPREGQSCIVHDGKMWITGGTSIDTLSHSIQGYNDVWCSNDGVAWKPVTRNAGWPARAWHSSVSFDGKLWVLGRDAWCSADGVNWTQTAASLPWQYKSRKAALSFDGAMWVMGGDDGSRTQASNEVWKSVDGVTWTLVTNSAQWGARYGLSAVVFEGKMWIAGGYPDYTTYFSDVWCSSDGVAWTQTASGVPTNPIGLAVNQGRMWITAALTNGAVWSSSDGVNWRKECETPGWPAMWDLKTMGFLDRIWMIDGHGAYASSSNGVMWDRSSRSVPWGSAVESAAAARNDTCWLAPGRELWWDDYDDRVFRTSDGFHWTLGTSTPGWTVRSEVGLAEYDGQIWLAGGFYVSGEDGWLYDDVWSSTDGVGWTQVQPAAPWSERAARGALLAYAGKLWLVGGGENRDVWNTTDGVHWTRATAGAPWQSTQPQAIVHNNRIWVRSEASNNLWWTTDGAHWQETFNEAPAGTQAALNGKIWIFEPLYDGRMWSSADGETWTLSDVKVPFGDRTGHTTFVYNNRLWVTGGGGFSDLWYFQEKEVPFGFTVLPQGGWKEEGTPWQGRVEAVGLFAAATYQWRKDGADIPNATTDTLSIPALALTDSGSYTCVLTDVATGAHETPPARIDVFLANSLPGPSPIALLIGCFALFVIFAFSVVEKKPTTRITKNARNQGT